MANIKCEKNFKYDGGNFYQVKMTHRGKFPWWCLLFLLIPIGLIALQYAKSDTPDEPRPWHEDEPLPKPTENCGVHFCGGLLTDEKIDLGEKHHGQVFYSTIIFQEDFCSEYVGQGFFPDNTKAFPKAVETTFDSFAVSAGTRLIIYREPNYEGGEVINIKGPALVYNCGVKSNQYMDVTYSQTFTPALQKLFPPERRQWSSEDMHNWSYGSCKIICEKN